MIDSGFDIDWEEEKPNILVCGRCYEEVNVLHEPSCKEHPETMVAVPIGMYHCPDCGAMVVAGIPHPLVCDRCKNMKHPLFDL